jgi:hypothetical protein
MNPTHRMSAVRSRSGTASGSKNFVTTTYGGADVGITPRFDARSAASVARSGGPPIAAPHRFFPPHSPNDPEVSSFDWRTTWREVM